MIGLFSAHGAVGEPMFLGWTRATAGFDVDVRQLRDTKVSAVVEGWDFDTLRAYARQCAWGLARAGSIHDISDRALQISLPRPPKSVE
jgi:hypothetical protein